MSRARPSVAVLLAAYNGMAWIEAQVASILAQRDVAVQLYISVDESDDGTFEWCSRCAIEHPNVFLLSMENSGGASQNFFRLVRDVDFQGTDYVAFADQDDLWHPGKLARAVQVLVERGVQAYSSNVTAFWSDGTAKLIDKAQPQVRWDYLFEAAGPGCTYVLNQALATHLQAFVAKEQQLVAAVSMHDWCIYAFARSHGYSWHIDEWSSMEYRQHRGNVMGANTGLAPMFSRLARVREGWWFAQIQLMARVSAPGGDSFTRRCVRLGRLRIFMLAFKAGSCRRRRRDQLLFAMICLAAPFFVRCKVSPHISTSSIV